MIDQDYVNELKMIREEQFKSLYGFRPRIHDKEIETQEELNDLQFEVDLNEMDIRMELEIEQNKRERAAEYLGVTIEQIRQWEDEAIDFELENLFPCDPLPYPYEELAETAPFRRANRRAIVA